MNRAILAILAILACLIPLTSISGDDQGVTGTTIYGTVYDLKTGEPVSGAEIIVYDSMFSMNFVSWTGDDGTYSIDVGIGGDYYVYVQKSGYMEDESNVSLRINEKARVDFRLDPIQYPYKIFGFVQDINYQPISDVYIEINSRDRNSTFMEYYTTESDAKFSFNVPNGSYDITYSKVGYGTRMDFIVVKGYDIHLMVTMIEWTQGVYGVVSDENGKPLEGVSVNVQDDFGSFYNITDKNGKYEIRVKAGDYHMEITADGYRPYSQDLTITDGTMLNSDIQLQKAYLPDPIVRIIYLILQLLGLV